MGQERPGSTRDRASVCRTFGTGSCRCARLPWRRRERRGPRSRHREDGVDGCAGTVRGSALPRCGHAKRRQRCVGATTPIPVLDEALGVGRVDRGMRRLYYRAGCRGRLVVWDGAAVHVNVLTAVADSPSRRPKPRVPRPSPSSSSSAAHRRSPPPAGGSYRDLVAVRSRARRVRPRSVMLQFA